MVRPPTIYRGDITVRALNRGDEAAWLELRDRNRAWLRPWEATEPGPTAERSMSFPAFVRLDRRLFRRRRAINMAIEHRGSLVGRVCISNIEWGPARHGSLGYWLDEQHAGLGIMPRAVAMLTEYGFRWGLHRVEIAARPENEASHRVATKLGFWDEGTRRKHLYIDGDWRDHRVFSLTADDLRPGEFWDS